MLKATIDRFEGDLAVLSFKDGQKLNWPKKDLPHHTAEGSIVHLFVTADEKATQDQKKLARDMLNEILKKNK